jgi:hypothetical protein
MEARNIVVLSASWPDRDAVDTVMGVSIQTL